jgi:hypothetical protein
MTHMAACLGNLNAEVVSAVAVGEYVPRVSHWYVGVSKWVEEMFDARVKARRERRGG